MQNSVLGNYLAGRKAKTPAAPRAHVRDLLRKAEVYGPPIPLTLEQVAEQSREDPLPLRGPAEGYYGAERHPAVLARQLQEFQAAFGASDRSGLPAWALKVGLVVITLVLGVTGFFVAPIALGQAGVVKGAGSLLDDYAPWVGAAVGLLLGGGATVWLIRSRGSGQAQGEDGAFATVYAAARITQVEWLDRLDREVPEETPGARRHPVRRMRTYLKRASYADRQEVFVPPAEGEEKRKRNSNRQERFRRGEIRIETTRDLRTIKTPHDLHDGKPLSGRWRGVNSLRWFVALKQPLETGLVALQYHMGDDLKSAMRKFFVSTYGFWILVVGGVLGTLLLFIVMDYNQAREEAARQVPDRTPVERQVNPEVTP